MAFKISYAPPPLSAIKNNFELHITWDSIILLVEKFAVRNFCDFVNSSIVRGSSYQRDRNL